ncbi:MAG: octanoyltransferase [Gammaproteobacteria bacterium]|nr:MAG: octanoyltransferase [Gammaproteobacteria bacterium]
MEKGAQSTNSNPIIFKELGRQDYLTTLAMMQEFTANRDNETLDQIWFAEHDPVFSCGVRTDKNELPRTTDIPVITTDRGGQITYHAPGQLLVYILFDLKRRSAKIREFIYDFETIMLNTVRYYSDEAILNKSEPGIFIKNKKIVSFGLKISKGHTYHGASINVSMNMAPWKKINICGKKNQQVTDLEREGITTNISSVSKVISQKVLATF